MSNHTPGPWQVEYDDLTEEWIVHWPDGYAAINGLMNGHQAQMIAAAPDLLEALCFLHGVSRGQTHEQFVEAIEMAEKAISKATGETG